MTAILHFYIIWNIIEHYFSKGGFNLHGNGAAQMVDRILSMLSQFLISNQSLEIDNSFRVYVKILSIDHMALKAK